MRRLPHLLPATLSTCLVGLALLTSPSARADVSSWLEVGGGLGFLGHPGFHRGTDSVLRLGTGMGSNPLSPIIVGGMLRTDTWFDHGTDLSLALRVTERGFVAGDWGAALDIGGLSRFWGDTVHGGVGTLTLGAPFGLQLSTSYLMARSKERALSVLFGIDLARLTIYRRSGDNWWRNPLPLDRPARPRP